MSEENETVLVRSESSGGVEAQLRRFEVGLTGYLAQHGLPSENILADLDERAVTMGNVQRVLTRVDGAQRARSIYLSKFIAAVATGLFDAALNYLWDETILELRNRVIQYDLSYFYDNAGLSVDKRKKVNTADDLHQLSDNELIHGAKEVGLISQVGFKHLDYIRYMRNWVSAAHPNQNEITGLQLISWLETCIKEVITLPLSNATVEIKKLLASIRTQAIADKEAKEIAIFFLELTQEQVNNLASGLFGIYTRADSPSYARDNVRKLMPYLWGRVDEETRRGFGLKYGRFVINNDQQEKHLAREFLAGVSGLQYIPDNLKVAEIDSAVEQLLTVHRSRDNFYSEPTFARQLDRLVGAHGQIPKQISLRYVHGLVEVFLTNGFGVAWNAEPIYENLLQKLDSEQALMAVLSFRDDSISSKLQLNLCRQKFEQLLNMMKSKTATPAMTEVIELIENSPAPLDKLKSDTRVQQKVADLSKIIDG
jgi:hypothetical protein